MDPGRYGGLQHGWENNSALDRYAAVHEPNFRASNSYDDRRYIDERFPRDEVYPRNTFHRDIPERDNYPVPPGPTGVWPPTRRRSYEDDYETREMEEYSKIRDSGYRSVDRYVDHGYDRPPPPRYRDRSDDYGYDDHDSRRERDYYDYGRQHSYDDSDYGSSRREGSWRRRSSRDRKGLSRERDPSPYKRSRSRGRDDRVRSRSRSRSPRSRSHREDSYDDDRYDRTERRRDRDEKRPHDYYSVVPSATVVVKGLSQKTTEEDLYQILAEWGPLRHVRVIKERNSGISRGFAFIDFPSTGSARAMMDKVGDEGLVVDGRKLYFEYSSKPAGGASGSSFGPDGSSRSGHMNHKSATVLSDWMCIICGCVNFARRTSCFQCNEARTDDAPPADMTSSNPGSLGKKGDMGPTHVLVVRGLDENADEEMLRYEFSKHVPIKDIRLVRDKFTHVSRGFAFVHFHTVDDATKALEATNGTTLEKNGQILRVAYAKSVLGSASGASSSSHSSSLAAAAIEAAAFAQQYDAVGWAPKEYNPDDKQSNNNTEPKDSSAPQSGFVWDEASGYYYDAASGFYYDGNTGLYYDGNNGIWYSYDHQSQQYVPCNDQTDNKSSVKESDGSSSNAKKVVISAPPATTSLPDAVQAAAAAAIAAEKKEKERMKEIKLASKSSILASKKKMSNVLSMWKQRSHENQAPRVAAAVHDGGGGGGQPVVAEEKSSSNNHAVAVALQPARSKLTANPSVQPDAPEPPRPPLAANVSGGTLRGVIRGSGRGMGASVATDLQNSPVPFRTDASALGSYTPTPPAGSGRRRFSESPVVVQSAAAVKDQQPAYRDRAAERRSLYGSSSFGEDLSDLGSGDPNRDLGLKRGSVDSMPFPPGVGGRGPGEANNNAQSFEVITAEKAIDETNVGNRMLRNMGWQEGLGLGKDGSGMVEPVQAQATEKRAGLGSQPKKVDPSLEVQAGDSYRTLIQKKALARFREMS